MAEILQACDFLTWGTQKWKSLIEKLVVFDIAPLKVLFYNCRLFSNCPLADL